MKLADLKWAAGVFVSAALRPPGHEDCECHPKLGYRGPRSEIEPQDGQEKGEGETSRNSDS